MSEELQPIAVQVLPAEQQPTISPGKRETTLDRLRAYFKSIASRSLTPIVLTPHQQDVLARLEAAWGLLLDAKTSEYAVTKLMRRFELSRAQAYRDLQDCKQLFGDVVESSRKADRYLLKEMALANHHRAKKMEDVQGMNQALALLVKITGIEKADPNIPDESVFEPSTYVLELPQAAGGEKKLTLNLEAIAQLPAHEYEQVMDYIQQAGTTDLEMLRYIQEAARGTTE